MMMASQEFAMPSKRVSYVLNPKPWMRIAKKLGVSSNAPGSVGTSTLRATYFVMPPFGILVSNATAE